MLGRTGSEGVHGMFREQSWKCCLRASLCRCKPNFRGSGVYVPRSVDWHPALWCIISLIMRNNDGNQVAPLTREHPRRRYTPVDYPWRTTSGPTLLLLFNTTRTSSGPPSTRASIAMDGGVADQGCCCCSKYVQHNAHTLRTPKPRGTFAARRAFICTCTRPPRRLFPKPSNT